MRKYGVHRMNYVASGGDDWCSRYLNTEFGPKRRQKQETCTCNAHRGAMRIAPARLLIDATSDHPSPPDALPSAVHATVLAHLTRLQALLQEPLLMKRI